MNKKDWDKAPAVELIEKIVTHSAGKDKTDIRFEFEDDKQWSVISMFFDDDDNELSLRSYAEDRFELYFGYYTDDDEFLETTRAVSPDDKKILPDGLKKLMKKVLADEEGMRVPGKLLSKPKA
jgi:hypothetical protein